MSESKMVTMSIAERDLLIKQAVMESQLDDVREVIPQIFASIKGIDKSIAEIPSQITSCRDQMEDDIKEYIHGEFVTAETQRADMVTMKLIVSKAVWVVGGFIGAGTFINWIIFNTQILNTISA